jgi:hypothetical protein
LDGFNDGCAGVSGSLKLTFNDADMYFASASATPSQINGNTLIWNFGNMTHDNYHKSPVVFFHSNALYAGDTIRFTAEITPQSGDENPGNNIKEFFFIVQDDVVSNFKDAYPQGKCDESFITHTDTLTYSIGFKNSFGGGVNASHVYVIDSISNFLDVNHISIVGKSHNAWTEVISGNTLKFHFKNINLLPNSGEFGWVHFEVDPAANGVLPIMTEIKNTAIIEYDIGGGVNTAIATNEIIRSIYSWDVDYYNCTGVFADVNDQIVESEIYPFPNPTSGSIEIKGASSEDEYYLYNSVGELILKSNFQESKTINMRAFVNGIYFLKVESQEKLSSFRIIKID